MVHNQKWNFQYDHFPLNKTGIGNLFLWVWRNKHIVEIKLYLFDIISYGDKKYKKYEELFSMKCIMVCTIGNIYYLYMQQLGLANWITFEYIQ